MFRTIAAATIVFAFAAFALHHPQFSGPFEEPILLLVMGSLFLLVGKLFGHEKRPHAAPAAALVEREA